MSATPQLAQPQRFGKYILLDRINVGGMAEVFRGKQIGVEGFQKMVALKRILPDIAEDQDFIEMFIDEAKLAVQMAHANVVQIYDLGQADSMYYIAMEYVSGVDLRTIWDRARRRNRLLPIAMSCYVMQRVCEGLDYAHRKKDDMGRDIGLVHRDVSPQNVLISFEGEVKVVDFGIAKAKNKISKTQAGILKGKFGYMSPEQVRGMELDNRSDIFACGAVLYELLVGERLFLGESDFSTLEKVRNVEMVPPTQLNKNLSPQVERIVMKALQKNRDDRYRFASEMAEDLQRYLFASNQPFARTDLQRYMRQHFKQEIDTEYQRIEQYRSVSLDDSAMGPAVPSQVAGHITMDGPAFDGPGLLGIPNAPTIPAGPNAMGLPPGLQPRPVTITHLGMAPTDPALQPGLPNTGGNGTSPQPLARIQTIQAAAPMHPQGGLHPGMPGIPGMQGMPAMTPMGIQAAQPGVQGSLPMQQMPGMQQMMPAQLGLPMWAKLLIAGLSLIALIALALVIYVVILGGLKPSPGSLMINVQPPSAEIVVDGEVVATKSPFNLNGLEPKTYVVEARKSGYKSVIRPVKITAGEPRVETIVLEPDGERAGVLVRSVPEGLAIWVDGKDTGQVTPSTLSGLVAGDHELELRQGADVVHQRSLSLKPGGVDGVDVDITKIPPVLEVRSNQVGARVFVEDRPVGATPIKIDTLRPGKVTVRVEMKDCQPYSARAELKQAVTTLLDAELSCKGAAGKGADEMGKVNVTATTVADVFIDGKKVGRTPALGLRVPVGSHIVKLVPLSGDKPPHTEEIVVEPMPKLVSLDHRF